MFLTFLFLHKYSSKRLQFKVNFSYISVLRIQDFANSDPDPTYRLNYKDYKT